VKETGVEVGWLNPKASCRKRPRAGSYQEEEGSE
jgi:hypothetical protein